jgi:hypothetical protein
LCTASTSAPNAGAHRVSSPLLMTTSASGSLPGVSKPAATTALISHLWVTYAADIKLNARVSLRRLVVAISFADDARTPFQCCLCGRVGCRGGGLALVPVCLCRPNFQALRVRPDFCLPQANPSSFARERSPSPHGRRSRVCNQLRFHEPRDEAFIGLSRGMFPSG